MSGPGVGPRAGGGFGAGVPAAIQNTAADSQIATDRVHGFAAAFDPLVARRDALTTRIAAAEAAVSDLQEG